MKSTSIIISTYNKPHFLEKVLTGYSCQIYKNFDIIIADDGSTEKTREVIDHFKEDTDLDIKHVWQKDNGFQKCAILNKAIEISENDYLIFTDGDCIPNQYFVKIHINLAENGYFLSGGHFPLNASMSELVTKDTIISQKCFNKRFLLINGQMLSKNYFKMLKTRWLSYMLDKITLTNSTFNGGNTSAWRKDILRINGFDERMEYGAEDRELGYRLNNIKIKSKQIRNRAICLHLDHDRPYKNSIALQKNRLIRDKTVSEKSIYTLFGIKK